MPCSCLPKGAFKYYVIKEVGGWVGQMMMFDDKVGGWEWLNDDVIKKYTWKKNLNAPLPIINHSFTVEYLDLRTIF